MSDGNKTTDLNGDEKLKVKYSKSKFVVVFWLAATIGVAAQTRNGFDAFERGMTYITQDYAKAAYWFQIAANQGVIGGQAMMGGLYLAGKGVPQDYAKAYFWSGVAAERGDAAASKYHDSAAQHLPPGELKTEQQQISEWLQQNPLKSGQ